MRYARWDAHGAKSTVLTVNTRAYTRNAHFCGIKVPASTAEVVTTNIVLVLTVVLASTTSCDIRIGGVHTASSDVFGGYDGPVGVTSWSCRVGYLSFFVNVLLIRVTTSSHSRFSDAG